MGGAATDDQSKQAPNPYPPPPIYSNSYPTHPPPPYQPYPPPYAFAAPPPAAYYSNPHNYPPVVYQESTSGHLTFAKFLLTTMTFLLVGACAMSFLTWLIFGSLTPDFSVKSLSVPSFNVSNSSLTAAWDVNITVKNSNEKLDVFFERLEAVIVYEDTVLGLADTDPFHLSPKGEVVFEMKASTNDLQQESFAESYRGLVEDRRRGRVSFAVRMAADATLRSGTMWRRQLRLRVFCEDLEVKFDGPTGPGKLEDGTQKECLIYV
ncbi:hypothetical protein RHSIM_Rhsim03G0065900 [Rhododendron simsii]|uniref:Late embryogenesis abundant protein LEA-2 subgroup domain-containing protein n=1 Tax=Rhododendron simsii TaxID=118357 RepID=A0A834LUR0_RHOSS|nr:hypothetical protein RHSIM_Rhsim03G0065900 [Rhododendron simsii]